MLIFLLIIIAVGVLLCSGEGQAILGGIAFLLMLAAVAYCLFYLGIFIYAGWDYVLPVLYAVGIFIGIAFVLSPFGAWIEKKRSS